jgi:phosphate-selective porin OprO and OprP
MLGTLAAMLLVTFAAPSSAIAADDDEKKPARTYTDTEIEALQDLANRVMKLEERQQDSEKQAAAKEKQEDQKSLQERVSKLEKTSAVQTWDASKMLSFSTPDGNFTARIGGRFFFVYRNIFDGPNSGVPNKDSFLIDTARVQVEGSFYQDYYYRLEAEGKSGTNGGAMQFNEVFLGWRGLGDWLAVQAGVFKAPLSQEETTSSRFIDFAERSVLNRISIGREPQFQLYGSLLEKVVEWHAGLMNGPTFRETTKFIADNNDEKDCYLRVFLTPLRNADLPLLQKLRIGVDGSRGKRDDAASVTVAAVTSGDLGLANLLPAGPPTIFIRGTQTREHLNFSWLYGPMSLRAEYARVRYEIDGGNDGAFVQKAWYVAGTYILTGEEKPLESRIKPKNNFDPLAGGWGAWELAFRYAVIDGGDGVAAGVYPAHNNSNPLSNTRTTEYTFGINWWMAPNVAVRFNWEHLIYDADQPYGRNGALKRAQDVLYIRWQIDF